MVSRFLFRLRALLPALALVFFCGSLAPSTTQAKNPYDYTNRTEGDPGDGVLGPAAAVKGTDSAHDAANARAMTNGLLPATNFCLVPIQVPGSLPGYGAIVFLPTDWPHLTTFFFLADGREHNAP